MFDAGEDQGLLYIAMRFIDGADLKHVIEGQQGPLDIGFVSSIISQVAGALDVAHAAGLVHRDVKPGNILLAKDMRRAYLGDFRTNVNTAVPDPARAVTWELRTTRRPSSSAAATSDRPRTSTPWKR